MSGLIQWARKADGALVTTVASNGMTDVLVARENGTTYWSSWRMLARKYIAVGKDAEGYCTFCGGEWDLCKHGSAERIEFDRYWNAEGRARAVEWLERNR